MPTSTHSFAQGSMSECAVLMAVALSFFALQAVRMCPEYRVGLQRQFIALFSLAVASFLWNFDSWHQMTTLGLTTALLGFAALMWTDALSRLHLSHDARHSRWVGFGGILVVLPMLFAAVDSSVDAVARVGSASIGLVMLAGAKSAWGLCSLRPRAVALGVAVAHFAAVVLAAGAFLASSGIALPVAVPMSFIVQSMGSVLILWLAVGYFFLVHELYRTALLSKLQRDGLTGLYVRRVFFEKAAAWLKKTAPGTRFAVVMVDLDHFKRVNDTFGHVAGDHVLSYAARLVQSCTRVNDLTGRYGGEEFCVLLKDCSMIQARQFAHRLLAASEQPASLRDGRSVGVTFSVGVAAAEVTSDSRLLDQLLHDADLALMRAKASGRNCVQEASSAAASLAIDGAGI